jgi:5'-3' exonuclease
VPTEYQSLFNGNYFYPDQYGVDMIYKRYFWQTQPILPDMSYKQIKKMYGKVKTTAKKPDSKLEAVIVRNVVAT